MQHQQTTTAIPDARHPMAQPHLLRSLEWRFIRSYRGGRVVAVPVIQPMPPVFYFGACARIWKTPMPAPTGNISDAYLQTAACRRHRRRPTPTPTSSMSAWVNAAFGATSPTAMASISRPMRGKPDASGLKTRAIIARVRIHPTNPDLVYVPRGPCLRT